MIDAALAQRIVEGSTDFAILTLDPAGLITSWNPGAEHLLGWAPDALIGRHARIIFTTEDQAAGLPEHEMARALREGRALDERYHMRADGSRFWGSGLLMRLDGAAGFVKIVQDRTQEREAQAHALLEKVNISLDHARVERSAELAESHRLLRNEIAERERIEEALRQSQKMEAIGQLTGGVAHDFNNLLTVILGSVDLLRRPNLSEEKRERYLNSIAETAGRAATLTNQLLAFARRQPLKAEAFDVAEHLRASRDMLRSSAGGRIEIILDVRCPTCIVAADPGQFDTAILNMAVNARDAMADEGTLTIAVEERDGVPATRGHAAVAGHFAAISVSDTGSGIAAADLARIFEPFFTTKDVGHGTGLGLSQVFGFAKQSGGEIAIESAPGRGATFTLYLPSAQHRAETAHAHLAPPTTSGIGAGGCVLLVEDNQLVGEFAAQLVGDLGYGTLWVSGAQEALALVEADPERFDIVFTDVVMPGTSGIELAETLRARYPRLPVVLTSGYSHVLAAEGTHGFDLLHKPYTAQGLAHALQAARHAR